MKPRLVVDNSQALPCPPRSPEETPLVRITGAWRAMQDVILDHAEGELSDQETLDIFYGYLNDPRLNADVGVIEP
jgi:hypothetical protein